MEKIMLFILISSKALSQEFKLPNGYKLVPNEEICIKQNNPCKPKKEEVEKEIKELDKKLKYECPPCRKQKIVEKIVKIPEYITKEVEVIKKIPVEKIVEKVKLVKDRKDNYLYLSAIYAQDGIYVEGKDSSGYVYSAETYKAALIGGGYTRFIEYSDNLDIGIGFSASFGQTIWQAGVQAGIKF